MLRIHLSLNHGIILAPSSTLLASIKHVMLRSILLFSFLWAGVFVPTQAQQTETPEALVQRQLEAYNNRDLDAFMDTFHEEVSFYGFRKNEPFAKGQEAVRKLFAQLFEKSPNLHSNVVKRIVIGNTVIDHEHITGRQGTDEMLQIVMIYEVKDGAIFRATSIRE